MQVKYSAFDLDEVSVVFHKSYSVTIVGVFDPPSFDAVSMTGMINVSSLQNGQLALGPPPHMDKFHLSSQQQMRRGLMGGAMDGIIPNRALIGSPHSGKKSQLFQLGRVVEVVL